MAVSVIINNKTFNIPTPGQDPGWGGPTTDWIVEANKVISKLFGPGDILQSSFNIANNVLVAQPILALAFNTTIVRSAFVEYSIYRRSDLNPSGSVETGVMQLVYDANAPATEKWKITQDFNGDAGITFSVDDIGQISYLSTDINSTGYTGVMKFKASALSQ